MTTVTPSQTPLSTTLPANLHPLPRPLASRVTQKDGDMIGLRPITAHDGVRMAEYLDGLSDLCRTMRFLSPKNAFTATEIERLVNVDQRTHMAWQAFDLSHPDQPIIAEARFVRASPTDTVAEFAVSVADEYQGQGLGKTIMNALAQAAQRVGVDTFDAFVRRDNRPMLRYLGNLGGILAHDAPGILKTSLPVLAFIETTARAA